MTKVPPRASRTNISADSDRESGYRLGPFGALWWVLRCFINNLLPAKKNALVNIKIGTFRPTSIEVSEMDAKKSPGRLLLDRFLDEFPWQRAVEQLGPISIIDFGCGRGGYTAKLGELLGDQLRVAYGLDLMPHEDWDMNAGDKVHFEVVQKDFLSLPEHNFVISVTSLEHVQFDAGVIDVLTKNLNQRARPSIQVHILPAPGSLSLYLTHGYRQYSISTIAKLFGGVAEPGKVTVFGLGGIATARVHRRWIRNGLLGLRGQEKLRDPVGYQKALSKALSIEKKTDRNGPPIFYAVVIEKFNSGAGLFE